ncbi:MAG TPA: hypothetical protein VE842_12950 [Pyrinomonadaceae bacterium]|nr:hypothetical protein [Pyrinomonadaceae bacterium]
MTVEAVKSKADCEAREMVSCGPILQELRAPERAARPDHARVHILQSNLRPAL